MLINLLLLENEKNEYSMGRLHKETLVINKPVHQPHMKINYAFNANSN